MILKLADSSTPPGQRIRQLPSTYTLQNISITNKDARIIFTSSDGKVSKTSIREPGLQDPTVFTIFIRKMMTLDPNFDASSGPWKLHPQSKSVEENLTELLNFSLNFLSVIWYKPTSAY